MRAIGKQGGATELKLNTIAHAQNWMQLLRIVFSHDFQGATGSGFETLSEVRLQQRHWRSPRKNMV